MEGKPIEKITVYYEDGKAQTLKQPVQDVVINDEVHAGKIALKKNPKKERVKRVSYYLKLSTINKIEQLSIKSGMGISEFLQHLLDETLENIIIEE